MIRMQPSFGALGINNRRPWGSETHLMSASVDDRRLSLAPSTSASWLPPNPCEREHHNQGLVTFQMHQILLLASLSLHVVPGTAIASGFLLAWFVPSSPSVQLKADWRLMPALP